jgi:hypothetical protein
MRFIHKYAHYLRRGKMSLNLIMGARNGAKNERQEHDYYATHPQAVRDIRRAMARYKDRGIK